MIGSWWCSYEGGTLGAARLPASSVLQGEAVSLWLSLRELHGSAAHEDCLVVAGCSWFAEAGLALSETHCVGRQPHAGVGALGCY